MGQVPFQTLVDVHGAEVHRLVTAMAGRDEADDCFQETFLAAMRAYPRLPRGANVRAWLLRIAQRKAIDAHRARRRRPEPVAGAGTQASEPAADGEPALWALVRALPPKQRAAVAHRFVSDLRYAEIGELLDCSEEAARQSVHAGLEKLRKEWRR
jgi:RNA polymerase sigma factor (sigma-70 family)